MRAQSPAPANSFGWIGLKIRAGYHCRNESDYELFRSTALKERLRYRRCVFLGRSATAHGSAAVAVARILAWSARPNAGCA